MKRHVLMTVVVLLGTMLFSAAQATDLGSEPRRKPVFGVVTVAADQVARLHAYNASRRAQKVELLFTDAHNRLLTDPLVAEVEPGTTATLEYDPAAQPRIEH